MRSRILSAVATAAFLVAAVGVAAPAQAATTPYSVTYTVINKRTVATNYVNYSDELARCYAASPGIGCSINRTREATRSIQLSLGATRGVVSAGLGISGSLTETVGVTCSAAVLQSYQSLRAYPVGPRYSYQIQKRHNPTGLTWVTETSGTLYAFNPVYGFACAIR